MESYLLREARAAARAAVAAKRTVLCTKECCANDTHRRLQALYERTLCEEIERRSGRKTSTPEVFAIHHVAHIDVPAKPFRIPEMFIGQKHHTRAVVEMATGSELRTWYAEMQEFISRAEPPPPHIRLMEGYRIVKNVDDPLDILFFHYPDLVDNVELIPKEIERRKQTTRKVHIDLLKRLHHSLVEGRRFFGKADAAGSPLYWLHMAPFVVTGDCKEQLLQFAPSKKERKKKKRKQTATRRRRQRARVGRVE